MMQHYYSEKQEAPLRPIRFETTLRGFMLVFHTGSGVFSKEHVDPGSRLLAESVDINGGERVLDIGCGYGIIGIALAKSVRDCELVMTDVNSRAIGLAKRNCKENNLDAAVIHGSLYDKIEGQFDMIVTNPPQNAGKAVCIAMMEGAQEHLKKGGRFCFVARHRKGGKSLSAELERLFGNLTVLDKKSGYRVYMSRKT